MKNKQFNKTLIGKTGKDLINLMGAKGKPVQSPDAVAPAGATELALFGFWQTLLGHKNFGVKDDFFKMGGNSLKAIQLLSRISAQFHVQLTLTEIFLKTTITEIAVLIQDKQNGVSALPAIIEVKEKPAFIPLSYNQERIWFVDQLEGSTQYHIPAVFRLTGKTNIEALSFAFKQIVNRHEVLRTTIRENGGDRYQQIIGIDKWDLPVIDGAGYSKNAAGLQTLIQELINIPFELSKDYMLRAALIKLQDTEYVLVVTMHHIAADGWSAGIIINELVQLYKAFETGADAALQPLHIQYSDFAIWQRQNLDGPIINKELDYWKAKLEDVSPLQMPTDFARTAVQSFNGDFEEFTIDKKLTAQLQELGHQQGVTLFMTLLAAFKVLLYRYSGQQDISVGTAIAGRKQQELENLVGFFVNTLTLRDNVDNKQSFNELLQQVKTTTLQAFEHQQLPFEKIVEAVVKTRDQSRTPLFQVLFVLQNTPEKEAIELGEVTLTEEPFEKNKAKFELDISLSQTPEGLQGTIEYCTDLYSGQSINNLTQHYIQLLRSIVKNADQPVGVLPMLMEDEQEQLLVKLNDTAVNYPTDKNYVDLFQGQVKRTPDSIAVSFEGKELTYKMLDEKSNQLAHYLRALGIKEETLVPICLERSLEMIIGILGILKAGAAYVPIDPEYPEERILYMTEDTAATVILTTDDSKNVLPLSKKYAIISIDGDWENIGKQLVTKVANDLKVNHPAYVIYTSGSTGKPKGVINEHGGLVNRLLWAQDNYDLKGTDVFLQKTTFCFDVSVTELCWPLITGAKLVFAKPGGHRDTDYLHSVIDDENVTIIHFVPSMLGVFLSAIETGDCPGLKQVLSSGEALLPSHAAMFTKKLPGAKLHNLYGPTEAAIDVTYCTLKDFNAEIKLIPIGKPVANTAIYILDKDDNLAPLGGVGEIHIGGVQVARGYLNRPELTIEKFVTDPFSKVAGARMYRTGDLGRWQQDGNIVYLGRIDDQVKIRGFRIELGEIEECVSGFVGVKNAKVLVIEDDASFGKKLCAYLETISPINTFDNNEFIQHIELEVGKVLPGYMVPADFILLDKFPLTANGKIDKKALPIPNGSTSSTQPYVAPRTDVEKALVNSWQKLLGKDRIGINDNFFESGGHSLLGMSLVSAIRHQLNVELSIRSLFAYPTVKLLADHLNGQTKNVLLPEIKVEQRPQFIPLSYSQERLWFIDKLEGTVQYHLPAVLRLKGTLNTDALSSSLKQIVNRHEVLRTVYLEQADGSVYQSVKDKNAWQLTVEEDQQDFHDQQLLQHYIASQIRKPFDLSKDDMLRCQLIKLSADEHLLITTMHHIASDGWSTTLLMNEVVELYKSFSANQQHALSPLAIQYADYAIWQRKYLLGEILDKKIAYWKNKLQDVAPLQLPADFTRPPVQSTRGSLLNFNIEKQLTEKLQQFSLDHDATLFMTLLAGFNVLLHRYTNQQDICVGSPVANRNQQETESLIGFFVNTLALRMQVDGESSVTALLQQAKSTLLDAYENQEVPFEKVVEVVVKQRDVSRSPLCQVMFVLQNTPEVKEQELSGLTLSAVPVKQEVSKFDITFSLAVTEDGLAGSVEYCTDLYTFKTINRMVSHFVKLLESMVLSPAKSIGTLSMLSDAETEKLLVQFNNNNKAYPINKTLVALFEEQSIKNPSAIALVEGAEIISYGELNDRSNQLANYLISSGVKPEMPVTICLDRSINLIVGMLGILKAGAAYVPIDSEYPAERIGYILEDTTATVILTNKESLSKIPQHDGVQIIQLDQDWPKISQQPVDNLQHIVAANQLAYIIYTSGSTGKPKGVMVEHAGVVNLVNWHIEAYEVTNQTAATAMAGIGFDAFGWEVWPYLCAGAAVYLVDNDTRLSTLNLIKFYDQHKISHSFLSTALVAEFVNESRNTTLSLKYLLTGGDKLSTLDLSGIHYSIVNNYGPTENSVVTTAYKLNTSDQFEVPPIGKPIANNFIRILNDKHQLVPEGVTGEICIGGAGLARGYWNLPEQTTEKFITDNFSKEPGQKLYASGDLGKWLPDGNIAYQGRVDEQVKIRGYRIELGEIEAALTESDLIEQVVVLAKEDSTGNKQLVAYVVPAGEFDKNVLVNYLGIKLPAYMIPAAWVAMESLPLTANGKIDKKALPEPQNIGSLIDEYVAPRNETEHQLAEIWQQLIKKERIGIKDNFFELGGHSLMVMRLVTAIRKSLNVELPIRELFVHPTIELLSKYLVDNNNVKLLPVFEKQTRPAKIPLSFSQERLWFIDQLEGSVQYNAPVVLLFKGNLNIEALNSSLQAIVNRHEVLRTVLSEEDGLVYQSVKHGNNWELGISDGSAFSHNRDELEKYTATLIRQPFDLSKDYMLRATLISLPQQEHLLVVALHHIASDAWSLSILVKELAEFYRLFTENTTAQLPVLDVQYADFSIWQRNYLQGKVLEDKLAYWKTKLEDVAPLQLPVDYPYALTGNNAQGASASFKIDNKLSAALKELSRQQDATLYMTLLTVYKILLARYSGQTDISVGASIANRPQQAVEGLVGFFVNTLALRDEVNSDLSFTELLQHVRTTTLEAYQHQDLPFEKVVEAVVKDRDTNRSPLFQVMMVFLNTPEIVELHLGDLTITRKDFDTQVSRFDLTFFFTENVDGLNCFIEYRSDLFKPTTINRMMEHYQQLLHAVLIAPDEKIGKLPMVTTAEKHALLESFNTAKIIYPTDKSIVDLFEEQVSKTPDATAIVFEGALLSYATLNEKANQLANHLKSLGVEKDDLVPLYVERGLQMMVGILGILKAGAAYVSIDTDFPQDRISYLLEDTNAKIILCSRDTIDELKPTPGLQVLEINDRAINNQSNKNLSTKVLPGQLAYVIYTSGSTGKPKGVLITHSNLVDYYYGLDQSTKISQCKTFALVSTIATDLGNTVIYGSLLSGGALHVFTKETVSNIEELHSYFKSHPIDCLKIVPGHWKALSQDEGMLLPQKLLVFGGEALPTELAENILHSLSSCVVVNHYGPTETTIGKLLHVVKQDAQYGKTIPIGKPFSNTQVYILSKDLQPCPIGVPGQLFIAGDGVAKGYYNNPDLTNEKFIPCPFSKTADAKMYSTGDLVKYLPDGNIEFIGRVDDQVKIRGYRVELGEIESLLQQLEAVSQAVVLARDDQQGNKRLVAYVVPTDHFDEEEILTILKNKLPEYMVPSVLVSLDNLPLTANGKVDRKALPDPDAGELAGGEYVAPRNEAESKLAAIWEAVLEVDQVGIYDDFFELGGHSLLAVRLISAIRKAFKVEMPIGDIFDYPTVALLAGQVTKSSDTTVLPPITVTLPRPAQIPLSFSQERLWFIDRMEGSVQYHVPTVLRLKGQLNRDALTSTLQHIVNRHEVLRTVFIEEEGQACQQVKESNNWQLETISSALYSSDENNLQNDIRDLINRPFDLSTDDMLRATLIPIGSEEHVLVIVFHHIASDGWSASILVKEVVELYSAYESGREPSLKLLPIQYADFAIWQRNYLKDEVLDKKLDYWKNKLQGTTALQLPTDHPRPAVHSTNGALKSFYISKEIATQLQLLSQQQGATLYMALLAAFKILLHRYSGQQDICVGTPIAGRQQQETESLIGFFVNTLALRTDVTTETPFNELLQKVKATTMEALAHQDMPFEKVVEAVVKERDLARSPLFQVMFIFQNTPEIPQLELGALNLSVNAYEQTKAPYDISLYITDTADGLPVSIQYCTDLYNEATIDQLFNHFTQLLQSIIDQPEQQIGRLPMLGKAEGHELLVKFNNTGVTYPKNKAIIGLFEEQVSKTPDSIALIFNNTQLTYQQLNERANRLAHLLISKGVQGSSLVPVCIERSMEMLIGILGVLKAGAVYVPIDTDYPEDRINYMLEDTGARVLLTNVDYAKKINAPKGVEVITVSDSIYIDFPANNLAVSVNDEDLFCIAYTSGSTGKPKGVQLSNHAIINRMYWMWNAYPFTANETAAIKTSIGFVDHVWEMFGPLCAGVPSVIFTKDDLLDLDVLFSKLGEYKITRWVLVPSLLRNLLIKLKEDNLSLDALKYWTCSGEVITADLVQEFYELFPSSTHTLLNIYGSSEVTADVTCFETSPLQHTYSNVPIGKPISNCQVYILDRAGNPVPKGVTGEICIGGVPVAKGYWNQPQLTNEKFVRDHFSNEPGAKLYKTGDLGCWLADGNIGYLGRTDNQVKIRGYRIELGEIENVLNQHEMVQQGVVMARNDVNGNLRLVSYVVPEGDYDKDKIIIQLRKTLPEYMVPLLWVMMENFPLTSNGKIDKKALPDPGELDLNVSEYEAPVTDVEIKLASIWQELLKVERIGINDNFFESGGHSLLGMRVIAAARKVLGTELAIKDLFQFPTIKLLAAELETKEPIENLPVITVQTRPEFIPLSFSQERLWFIDRLEGTIQYHLPAVLRLKGKLNKEALEKSIQELIGRHEVLRTIYLENEGKAYQVIMDKSAWNLTTTNADNLQSDKAALQQLVIGLIQKPFDLSKDYMLRATLVTLNKTEHILVINTHHIASDGWSISILVNEVVASFKAFEKGEAMPLKPLPVQYADYAIWQRNYLSGDLLDNGIAYWKSKLDGVTALELPTDKSRPSIQTNNGATTNFLINSELAKQLKTLSSKEHTTMFMTLLAAFNVLLYRYSGQEDICVGSPIANRSQQEVEPLIGFFVNTLALRSSVDGGSTFTEILQQVKQTTLDAYQHQQVPFEKVVDAVANERDMSRSPVFQVMFVLQNTPEIEPIELGEMVLSAEEFENSNAKFDITLYLTEKAGAIQGAIEYNTDLYQSETIRRMIAHFTELLGSILATPNEQINKLQLLSKAEKEELLVTFNNTDATYPLQKNIVSLFEEQVAKSPAATALIFDQQKISYSELNERSNQLAHYLMSKGVTTETLVPICIERGFEMIVGIVAILKAGGVYVPIDPEYPEDRISYMLEDTAAEIVIVSKESRLKLPAGTKLNIVDLDAESQHIKNELTSNPGLTIQPNQLAYIIYTSGSTGKPKGVMIEHSNVVRLFYTDKPLFDFNEKDVWTLFHSFCFDFSVWEMYGALLFGGSLVIVPAPVVKDANLFSSLLLSEKVTVLNQTPAAFYVLQDAMVEKATTVPVRYVIFGGEALNPAKLQPWKQLFPGTRLINMYGITETTVHVTFQEIGSEEIANGTSVIGKPIPTLQCYVLDANRQLAPVGVAGELYVGGAGVARGYLNRKELTAERFIEYKFSKTPSRLYVTGDLCRWLPGGSLEYLGRIDDQVKIRGYRIELGEIESVLQQSGMVSQSVVLAKANSEGTKRLIGYVVPLTAYSKEVVISYLGSRLPDYMVPRLWVELEQMPLTSNGKINKKALPDVDANELSTSNYVAPTTELEQLLSESWQQLLGVEKVGVHDNFFEIGGDSILTIQVVSRLRKSGYDLQPKDIFIHQTIARLSAAIAERALTISSGEQGALTGPVGLLPIQQWFLDTNQSSHDYFNQSVLLGIDKAITAAMLVEAFQLLAAQHDSLRLKFVKQNDSWQQEYGDGMPSFVTENLREIADGLLADSIAAIAATHQRGLQISTGKLVKVIWIQTPETSGSNRLLIIIHHLAIDGVSWRILLEDLEMLLTAITANGEKQAANKSSSYRQWYNTLKDYGSTPALLTQLPYWQSVVNGYQPLPVDKVHDRLVAVKDTRKLQGKLDAEHTRLLLQEVPRVYHTEMNDILLAALAATIAEWTKSYKVSIGMEGHGREDIAAGIDTTRTTGWFTTLYPISLSVQNDGQIDRLIKSVKEQLRRVPEKGLGYGVLKYINKAPELQVENNPWDIMFNYLGQVDNVVNVSKWFAAVGESTGANVSGEHLVNELLSVSAVVQGGELYVNWVYSDVHYETGTIKALSAAYVNKLQQLIDHCMLQQKTGTVHTPSDFGLGLDISYQELDEFLDEDDTENIISF